MPIASLKEKIVSIANDTGGDNRNSKKIEVIVPNFKSTPTIIARDIIIKGDISSSGMIEIEGRIKGNVKGNIVVLRENGFIEGEIIAESLSIRGGFDGKIYAQNIDISGKAKITGEIEYGSLSVEDGASIDAYFKQILA